MNLKLDNSAFNLLSCRRRFQLTVVNGCVQSHNQFSEFGDAFHCVQENISLGHTQDYGLTCALERTPKVNVAKLLETITLYNLNSNRLPPAVVINDQRMVEFKFCNRYGSYITEKGDNIDIDLVGTIDHITWEDGIVGIYDYKTVASFKEIDRKKKVDEYALRFQLPFYLYNLLLAPEIPEEMKEAIKDGRYKCGIMFIFYQLTPPTYQLTTYPPYSPDFIYNEIPLIINQKIKDAIKIYELGNDPAPHDGMCVDAACTFCAYKPACLHMGSEKAQEFLDRFDHKPYNPLLFR